MIDDSKTAMKQHYMGQEDQGPLLLVNDQLEAQPLGHQMGEGEVLGMVQAGSLVKQEDNGLETERRRMAEDIRHQIRELVGGDVVWRGDRARQGAGTRG